MGFTDDIEGMAISELLQQERFSMQKNLWRDIIKRGDIILEFDGKQVPDPASLAGILEDSYSGQTFRMIVISINHLRRTYQPLAVDVTLN